MTVVQKIVSGGQTGADRAALDFALEHGIPHGGWCPAGRKAEDGAIAPRYRLKETPSRGYAQRTECNVRDSDGTVVFSISAAVSGGAKRALDLERRHHKPFLHLWRDGGLSSPEQALQRFIRDNGVKVLNVAGARASKEPEVAAFVTQVLERAFGTAREGRGAAATHVGQPTLQTSRLILRPCSLDDSPTVARLAGRREIADTTITIPHPYSEQQAKDWVSRSIEDWNQGREAVFAMATRKNLQLVGATGLRDIDREHSRAEMSIWVGANWWGHGYATEAGQALLQFGFETLKLNRIYAHHMLRNPASGRVLEKLGLKKEGVIREGVRKWGVFEDVALLAVIKKDWAGRKKRS
jgi:[ribosomal protein S5]-alanine N-acetyltransferase